MFLSWWVTFNPFFALTCYIDTHYCMHFLKVQLVNKHFINKQHLWDMTEPAFSVRHRILPLYNSMKEIFASIHLSDHCVLWVVEPYLCRVVQSDLWTLGTSLTWHSALSALVHSGQHCPSSLEINPKWSQNTQFFILVFLHVWAPRVHKGSSYVDFCSKDSHDWGSA